MLLVAVALFAGSVFGLVFSAWALVPLTAAAGIGAIGVELALGSGWGPAALSCLTAVIASEFGYGVGLLLRKAQRLTPMRLGPKY
jgi:hypothetical protein